MDFDFDTVIDRQSTGSLKWNRYAGTDVIPMWVADMDFRSPPAVLEALRQRVEHGIFGYAEAPEELTDTICQELMAEYGWQVDPEWIVWLPGLVTGLNVAGRTVGQPGDAILTTVPIYPPFLTAPGNGGRNLVTVPLLQESGKWQFDLDGIRQAIGSRTGMFLLCNPYNPVGRVFTRSEISAVAEICIRSNVTICSDEIHCGLILDADKPHIPTAALDPEIARNCITLMAPSKTYNLPGLGCSFAVISDADLRQQFKKAMAGIVPHVTVFGYVGALAAYRHGQDWREALLTYLRASRDRVQEAVSKMPGLNMGHVEATYLAWIDTRETGIADPVQFFEDAGVGLSDGREFGGEGFVRLNFGCPRSVLDQALSRMAHAMDRR